MFFLEADLCLLEHLGTLWLPCIFCPDLWSFWPFGVIFPHLTKNVSTLPLKHKVFIGSNCHLFQQAQGIVSLAVHLCVWPLFFCQLSSVTEHCGKQKWLPPSVYLLESEVCRVVHVTLTQGEFWIGLFSACSLTYLEWKGNRVTQRGRLWGLSIITITQCSLIHNFSQSASVGII